MSTLAGKTEPVTSCIDDILFAMDSETAVRTQQQSHNQIILDRLETYISQVQFTDWLVESTLEGYTFFKRPDEDDLERLEKLDTLIIRTVDKCLKYISSHLESAERLIGKITNPDLKDQTILKVVEKYLELSQYSKASKLSDKLTNLDTKNIIKQKISRQKFCNYYLPKMLYLSIIAGSLSAIFFAINNPNRF